MGLLYLYLYFCFYGAIAEGYGILGSGLAPVLVAGLLVNATIRIEQENTYGVASFATDTAYCLPRLASCQ